MKVALSYSGGKDSLLALYRAVRLGHEPAALITTYNEERRTSHFHEIPFELLQAAAGSLGIPLILIKTQGDAYARDFEDCLARLREAGVGGCVFGDIDLEAHFSWCTQRCVNAGLQSLFPLRYASRRSLVEEFIEAGFSSVITVVDTTRLSDRYLGRILSHPLLDELESEGIDVCGENGEYHSFVFDGPLFKRAVPYQGGPVRRDGKYAFYPLQLEKGASFETEL